ncbi:hypothetical protein L6R50_05685 [Myxococcota bacterium]|nr:hypothetical protein [Myxococcota bacterium]
MSQRDRQVAGKPRIPEGKRALLAGALGATLLGLALGPGAASSPLWEPLAPAGSGHIELHLSRPVPRRMVDPSLLYLVQDGREIRGSIRYDRRQGIITLRPPGGLVSTRPFDLVLPPDVEVAMVPNGHLWITDGDPECVTLEDFQVDGDEDGIPDCNEKTGTYYWGQPLHYWGARVDQPDIFAEVRYMEHDEKPWLPPRAEALAKVRDVFAAAGYAVHFDAGDRYEGEDEYAGIFNLSGGDNGVAYQADVGWAVPEPDCDTVVSECVPDTDGWDVWSDANFTKDYADHMLWEGRERSFYYVLFANNASASNASGRTVNAARSTVITLGQFGSFEIDRVDEDAQRNLPLSPEEQANKIVNYQSAVLLHEMGHMFGLREGGDVQVQGKPNYFSSMSYVYMFPGLPFSDADFQLRYYNYQVFADLNFDCPEIFLSDLANGPLGDPAEFHIDYSWGTADSIDEQSLVEQAGVGETPWTDATGPIDWSCDGDATDAGFAQNVTGPGWYVDEDHPCGHETEAQDDLSVDHAGWANLRLYHREHYLAGEWPNAGLPFECPFPP